MPRLIRTERLALRAVSVDDAQAQTEAVNASVPELSRWMPWCTGPQDVAVSRENLERSVEDFEAQRGFEYVVWAGEDFAGRIGVHALDLRIPRGEIGYWTTSALAGRGHMTEAVRGLTDAMLQLGFRRVEIRCDALNAASARVAEKCGYTLDARLVNDDVSARDPSVLRDTLIWSVVR